MKIVSPSEMAIMDQKTIEAGITDYELMERAGTRCAEIIIRDITAGEKILVLCGTGNNGGDGLVIARLLYHAGYTVTTYIFGDPSKMTPSCKKNVERLKAIGASVRLGSNAESVNFAKADVIIDAVFGNGLKNRPISPDMKAVFDAVNEGNARVFAIDSPSGLRGDNGKTIGAAIKADRTLVIQNIKTGLLLNEGPDTAGEICIVDVGIDENTVETGKYRLTIDDLSPIGGRKKQSHKYQYGYVGVIAGSRGMLGAGLLACSAAIKTGAGLVEGWVDEQIYPIMAAKMPWEIMVKSYGKRVDALEASKVTVWLYGPGCGRTTNDGELLRALLGSDKPVVIDADGLWHLSRHRDLLKNHRAPLVISPHIGEFCALSGIGQQELSEDPVAIGRSFAKENNLILILKNHHTMIFTPDGCVRFNMTGNPGMATAGSGDVLAGMLAGFIAQTEDLTVAVQRAVCIHGLAGDMARDHVGECSLTASDIIKALPGAIRRITEP